MEGNVLFNDALNTFYLRLYGVGHMVKYHSDSARKPAAATWVHHEGLIWRPIAPWANTLTTELHLAPYVVATMWRRCESSTTQQHDSPTRRRWLPRRTRRAPRPGRTWRAASWPAGPRAAGSCRPHTGYSSASHSPCPSYLPGPAQLSNPETK